MQFRDGVRPAQAALKGKFSEAEWARIAIAYEPVWAIGADSASVSELF